ncbi:MAG: DUF898 domain-containing protein [Granulosicoccus sp.]|nr:DUF898 domain-containing protein [Granulosicoccus sp.]
MTTAGSGKKTHLFEFRGSGGEYFKIWIVNILLSILTLYIYSAWAKVRTNRYFYGNTYVADSSFEYHATPMQILKGRIIAVILLIIFVVANQIFPLATVVLVALLFLVTPWIIWRSLIFNARMSSYRNVRFNFIGKCFPVYNYLFFIPLIPLLIAAAVAGAAYMSGNTEMIPFALAAGFVVVYLLYPLTRRLLTSYSIDNAKYGNSQFKSTLNTSTFYKIYLKMIGLSILVYVLVVILLTGAAFLANSLGLFPDGEMPDMQNPEELFASPMMGPLMIAAALMYIGLIALGFLIAAYLTSRMRNYTYSNTVLDNRVQLASFAPARSIWWLQLSNFLLLIITLGLAYPWTKVRSARFYARHTSITAESLDGFISDQVQYQSSLGDEIGEAFDLDVGLGI